MKIKKKKQVYEAKYLVMLLITAFIIGLAFAIQKTKNTSLVSIRNQNIVVQLTSERDLYAGKRIVQKFPNENILWYHVTLQTDNLSNGVNRNPPLFTFDVLPDLYDLPMVKRVSGAVSVIETDVYNTQTGPSYIEENKKGVMYRQYNSDFYIAIKGFSLDLTKTYKNRYKYYADIYGCESPAYDLELLNPT